jgi:CRP-like cAMP-binding protein
VKKALLLLAELRDEDVDWLVRAGTRRDLAAGGALLQQGSPVDALFVLLEGQLVEEIAGGRPTAQLGPGEVVGARAFLDARPADASVRALVDAVLLELPARRLLARARTDGSFAGRFYRGLGVFLADRLRETERQLQSVRSGEAVAAEAGDGELNPELLDRLERAAARFQRLGQPLGGGG